MNSACGWTAIKLGDLVEGHRGVSYQPHDLLSHYSQDTVILLRANNIQNGRLVFNDVQIVPTTIVKEQQLLSLGDLAVCMSNGSKSLVGKSAQYDGNLSGNVTVGAFCSIFRTKEGADSDYIKQIFHSDIYQAHIDYSLAGSAINNLKNSDIESLELTVPPKVVQQKIARILQTIDRAIEQTEALIDKYQQIKAGLMHDLFTRGIGPDGQLRPPREQASHRYHQTPIGWIPKEWEVDRLGSLLIDIQAGKSPSCEDTPATTGEWGVLKVSAVHPDGFRSDQNKRIRSPIFVVPSYEVKDGDLLITRANTPELVGMVSLVKDPQPNLMLCDKTLRLVVDPSKASAGFFFLCMQQRYIRSQIENAATGTSMSMKNIGQAAIHGIRVAYPPIEEQQLIADFLGNAELKLRVEKKYVHKLQKQKSGLMHDLLTGKVSVTPDPEPVHG